MSKVYFFMDTTPVDATLATDKREAVSLTGKWPYYDKSARQTFESVTEKRRWMIHGKLREAGELYNPKRAPAGMEGNVRKHPRQQTCWKTAVSSVRPNDV